MTDTNPLYALGTFSIAGSPAFPGLVLGEKVVALNALKALANELKSPLLGTDSLLDFFDAWEGNEKSIDTIAKYLLGNKDTADVPLVDALTLKVHAPIEQPRQFFCSGANYFKHVVDLIVDQAREPAVQDMSREERVVYATNLMTERSKNGTPYIFSKSFTSITGPFDDITVPDNVEQPDWELELALVIGKPAFKVKAEDAYDYIAGYTIVNDLSNRELIHRQDLKAIGTDWVMGKSLPGYAPMGPYIVPSSLIKKPQDIEIKLQLNGEVMQKESTADMIFDIPRLLEYLTSRIQLLPGDIFITGSPSGNGSHYNRFLQSGDVLEGSIEGIGVQRNMFVAAKS